MLNLQEREFDAPDGTRLFYRRWVPQGTPKRLVVMVHGFADHSGRSPSLVDHLVAQGALVYAYDQRGSGNSGGQRGHIMRYQELIDDLDAFVNIVNEREAGVQLEKIAYAHSTGGILVMKYLLQHPDAFDRVVLSAPALILVADTPAWKTAMGKALAGILPRFSLDAGFPSTTLSRDPEAIARTDADKLVDRAMSTRFYKEVYLTAAPEMLARIEELNTPFFYIHGGSDPLVAPRIADEFRRRATAPGKVMVLEGSLHEWHNDLDKEKGFAELDAWLETPLSQLAPNTA